MQKQRIILIIGIVLGLIAVVITRMYIQQVAKAKEEEARQALEKLKKNQMVVMIARQDIPMGTVIQGQMLEPAIVPKEFVQPRAASAADNISGMATIAPIAKGEQVSLTKLTSSSSALKPTRRGLSEVTPVGKRAVTVSVDNIASLVGLIKPGDYVDVIAVLPLPTQGPEKKQGIQQTVVPVLQNVLILAVGQETSAQAMAQKEGTKDRSPLITLSLTPKEANLVAFLQEQGRIRLSMRSVRDSIVEPTQPPITWDNLVEYLPSLKSPEAGGETVEIYRGLNKEKMPLSKE